MKAGIRFKLILFTGLLLFTVLSCLSIFVLNGIQKYQDNEIQNTLFKQKDMFEQYFSEKIADDVNNDKPQLARGTIFNKPWLRNIPACLYNADGTMLSGFNNDDENNENHDKDKMINYAVNGQVSYKTIDNIVYFYSPLKYKDEIFAVLELKYSVIDRVTFFNNIKKMFYGTGVCFLILGISLGVLYFSKFTKDIYLMRNYVNSIQKGEFKEFKRLRRKDELGELSEGLIGMSSTIEKNINDLKVERDSLSIAVKKLKKMDKDQKEFIGSVTHEFKTPITTIKAYGDLISMYPDDLDLIEDGTHKISKECDRLSGLVENVLRLSALEKYDFEIEKQEVNLKDSLTEICERMRGRIIRNNLSIKYNLEDISINIDEESLKHIVINLIDNAVKYSRANGEIAVNCYKENNYAYIAVKDNGIGIDSEKVEKIFEPFYRVDKHRSREAGGAGLGLSIVKKLVEKQGGTIRVESKLDEGSTFYASFQL